MMKKLFDGLKVAIDVDVLGTIVKTNSPYVKGSTVTCSRWTLGSC